MIHAKDLRASSIAVDQIYRRRNLTKEQQRKMVEGAIKVAKGAKRQTVLEDHVGCVLAVMPV